MSIKNSRIQSPIIVALDYNNLNHALAFIDSIDPADCRLKIGKEMFTLFGPRIVRLIQNRGFEVFLDLKFHDIPHTCARAVIAAANLKVWMIDLHASGGTRMMTAAKQALKSFGKDAPLLVAVTMLTSMDNNDLQDLYIKLSPLEYVLHLARLTCYCGLDGVICSAYEAMNIKKILGKKFKIITPGIRLNINNNNDQRRVMTPIQAKTSGVDYMIIGRPITKSADPVKCIKEINTSLIDI